MRNEKPTSHKITKSARIVQSMTVSGRALVASRHQAESEARIGLCSSRQRLRSRTNATSSHLRESVRYCSSGPLASPFREFSQAPIIRIAIVIDIGIARKRGRTKLPHERLCNCSILPSGVLTWPRQHRIGILQASPFGTSPPCCSRDEHY
jgi:hypothetical protein